LIKRLVSGELTLSYVPSAEQRLWRTVTRTRYQLTCQAYRELNPVYRRLIKMALQHLQLVEQQITQLDQEIASLLHDHQDAVERLAEVPGLGIDSAHQILAEMGAQAESFESAKNLASWVGACPGKEESAGENRSTRSPKGNRHMRRVLNQCATAVKRKGGLFEIIYRRCYVWATKRPLGQSPIAGVSLSG
jgi:transposase